MFRRHCIFFFKQKTAYEMRSGDWSSDVCSSDLLASLDHPAGFDGATAQALILCQGPQAEERRDAARALMQADEMQAGARLLAGVLLIRLLGRDASRPIGRASCRERECQCVSIWVVAVSSHKKLNIKEQTH